jgi:hypothetical protein
MSSSIDSVLNAAARATYSKIKDESRERTSTNLFDLAGQSHAKVTIETRRCFNDFTDWDHNDADSLSDGCQSYINTSFPNTPGSAVADAWSKAAEVNFLVSRAPRVEKEAMASPLGLACFEGNAVLVRHLLASVGGAEATARLASCHAKSMALRYTPLMLCAAGARFVGTHIFNSDADYVSVARALVAAGANLLSKDILGLTALHHCCTSAASPTSLRVAAILAQVKYRPRTLALYHASIRPDFTPNAASFKP